MNKVAIYVRVSSEDQVERGTIEQQIEFAKKYCDLHGLDIYDWYKDDGVSGTLPLEERPEGSRMLQDTRNGLFETILIYRLDRFGRSARIILNGVYAFEQMGIKVKSMTEPFDTGDPSGRFLLTILAGVADLERDNILDRMWHGANRAAKQGKWLGGIVPYGYSNVEGYLVVNDTPLLHFGLSEADVVRMVYGLITEQKMSTIKIADYLNALNIPPKYVIDERTISKGKRQGATAGKWLPGRIRNMLVQPTYMGIHHYGKRTKKKRDIIEREVPAIVTKEVWEQAQEVLKENQIEAVRNAKHQYLLRSLVKCEICGLSLSGTYYKHTGKTYYICNGKTSYRGKYEGKCPSTNVAAEWLEEMVWGDCVKFIKQPGEMIGIDGQAPANDTASNIFETEMKIIKDTLDKKQNERHAIVTAFRKGYISEADLQKQMDDYNNEEQILNDRLAEIKKSVSSSKKSTERQTNAIELLEELQNTVQGEFSWEAKREIAKLLVDKVLVHSRIVPGRNIPEVSIKVNLILEKIMHGTV
jgi:site-specific DNA recombinase